VNSAVPTSQITLDVGDVEFTPHSDRGWRAKGGVVGAGPTTLLLLACMVVNYVLGPALEPDDWDVESTRRRQLLVGDQSYATGR
jgi:hypothetical protein